MRHPVLRPRPLRERRAVSPPGDEFEVASACGLPLLPRKRDCGADHFREKDGPGRGAGLLEASNMRAHYDFSTLKGRKNPYLKYLKQPVTIRLDRAAVDSL